MDIGQLPILAVGLGSIGLISASVALGIRHGIDWDHIAAITDITSTTASVGEPKEAWLLAEPGVMLTDESHHSLGADPSAAGAIIEAQQLVAAATAVPAGAGATRSAIASAEIPGAVSPTQVATGLTSTVPRFFINQRRALFLGTLYALGHGTVVTALGLLAILASGFLPEWIDPVMERVVGVTLILLALYLFYAIYRYFRGGEFRFRSRWMLVFAGIRSAFNWLLAKIGRREPKEHVHAADQYGVKTAYGIGMVHGIGAETGTQVLIITAAVGAGSQAAGITALVAFVVGLIISNTFLTVASTASFISAKRQQGIYVMAGLLAAVFSLVVGSIFLLQASDVLPDLGEYFRWIGGPDA